MVNTPFSAFILFGLAYFRLFKAKQTEANQNSFSLSVFNCF